MKARVTQRYARLRREFAAHIRDVVSKLKSREITLQEVQEKEVSYKMTIEDSVGYKETWCVKSVIGDMGCHGRAWPCPPVT